ncbi:MAG: hypothetical protein ACOC5T_08075 [Elusimicrobiota bacterium]
MFEDSLDFDSEDTPKEVLRKLADQAQLYIMEQIEMKLDKQINLETFQIIDSIVSDVMRKIDNYLYEIEEEI